MEQIAIQVLHDVTLGALAGLALSDIIVMIVSTAYRLSVYIIRIFKK